VALRGKRVVKVEEKEKGKEKVKESRDVSALKFL